MPKHKYKDFKITQLDAAGFKVAEFDNIKEAIEKLGLAGDPCYLRKACVKNIFAYGYKWKYEKK